MDENLSFVLDRAGFPMLWIEDIGAYMHWLPVTKIQFETFMCSQPESSFDERWYDEILSLNKRISPTAVTARNYWQSFLTGLTPDEAQRYASWCGDDFSLPTKDDWYDAYKALQNVPAVQLDFADEMQNISPRARPLLKSLDSSNKNVAKRLNIADRTLALQMFMRYGVLEWVETPNMRSTWGGMGEPLRDFHNLVISVDRGQVNNPINLENRMFYYGCRLIRRIE